jgi:hypothetical protein
MELDFSAQSHFLFALVPEIILCIWGMLVLIVGVWRNGEGEGRPGPDDLGALSLVGILLAAGANGWLYGVSQVGGDGMIVVDRFRLFANWIFLLAGALSILISLAYVSRQRIQSGEFYSLMLFAMVGMMMMTGTKDLIIIFLGLEVMSVSIYALAALNRRDRKSAEAGLKYFLLGAFSTSSASPSFSGRPGAPTSGSSPRASCRSVRWDPSSCSVWLFSPSDSASRWPPSPSICGRLTSMRAHRRPLRPSWPRG